MATLKAASLHTPLSAFFFSGCEWLLALHQPSEDRGCRQYAGQRW